MRLLVCKKATLILVFALSNAMAAIGCAGGARALTGDGAPRFLKSPADLSKLQLVLMDIKYEGFYLSGVALLHATNTVELLQILNYKTLQVRSLSQCDGHVIDVLGPDFSAHDRNLATIVLKKDEYYGVRFTQSLFSPENDPGGGPDCITFRLTYAPTGDFLSPDVLNYDAKVFNTNKPERP
jgi:hypothetical protein